jgi:16S rRNA (cytosine1402-N4)-methyltransferase
MLHHDPVLLSEVELVLQSQNSKKLIIDATLGLGGHAGMMLSHMGWWDTLLGFDRDSDNLALARAHLAKIQTKAHFEWVHASFADLEMILRGLGQGNKTPLTFPLTSGVQKPEVDFILYDLGVSSAHYDEGSRGFSLRSLGPLDMRFDRTTGKTAEDLVHSLSERELMHIFIRYADEKKALFIARAIMKARETTRIDTTDKLQAIVKAASFDPKSSLRVFQALRIAVNEEFEHIEVSLRSAIEHLRIWGKIAVITFHSIEDRIVKNLFAEYLTGTIDDITGQTVIPPRLRKYAKKPIEPTEEEIQNNPRSRSAKMRVVERIN